MLQLCLADVWKDWYGMLEDGIKSKCSGAVMAPSPSLAAAETLTKPEWASAGGKNAALITGFVQKGGGKRGREREPGIGKKIANCIGCGGGLPQLNIKVRTIQLLMLVKTPIQSKNFLTV